MEQQQQQQQQQRRRQQRRRQRRQQSAEASSRQSDTTTGDDSDETEHELAASERDGRTDIDDQQPSVVMSTSLEDVESVDPLVAVEPEMWEGPLEAAAMIEIVPSLDTVHWLVVDEQHDRELRGAAMMESVPVRQTVFVSDERKDDEKQQLASEVES